MYNDDQRQIEQLEKELAETHKLLEQYKKEQDASIIVFNRQNEQLEKVNQSNSDLREENKILKQTIKEQKQDITDLKKKIKENKIDEFYRKVEELELKKPPKTFQTHSVQTEINSFNKSPIVSKKTNMANVSEGLAYQ